MKDQNFHTNLPKFSSDSISLIQKIVNFQWSICEETKWEKWKRQSMIARSIPRSRCYVSSPTHARTCVGNNLCEGSFLAYTRTRFVGRRHCCNLIAILFSLIQSHNASNRSISSILTHSFAQDYACCFIIKEEKKKTVTKRFFQYSQ